MKTNCLYPRCESKSHCRGLCRSHYGYAGLLVRQKKTTWDKLVKAKKALDVIKGRAVSSWFLE